MSNPHDRVFGEWSDSGIKAVDKHAWEPETFIGEQVAPLFYEATIGAEPRDQIEIASDEEFWNRSNQLIHQTVTIRSIRIVDWFPRAPGVYWSRAAQRIRQEISHQPMRYDEQLGHYHSPLRKGALIEKGGIGNVRLMPRNIDGNLGWFGTAVTHRDAHAGIPLIVPDSIFQRLGLCWGNKVSLTGRVRFLHDVGLVEIENVVHHSRPLVMVVDSLKPLASDSDVEPTIITPVALFADSNEELRYTFVRCNAGTDNDIDDAAEWIGEYAAKHNGRVLTNFDEQRPILANAPLSYQRLVNKSYDRDIASRLMDSRLVERIDQRTVHITRIGEVYMGDRIETGDVFGGALGRGASVNARDIIAYSHFIRGSTIDLDLKERLLEARTEIDRLQLNPTDREDALTELEKLSTELSNPEPSQPRVARTWNQIKTIAPPVAAILSMAASLAKLLGG